MVLALAILLPGRPGAPRWLLAGLAAILIAFNTYATGCYALIDYDLWLSLGMPARRC